MPQPQEELNKVGFVHYFVIDYIIHTCLDAIVNIKSFLPAKYLLSQTCLTNFDWERPLIPWSTKYGIFGGLLNHIERVTITSMVGPVTIPGICFQTLVHKHCKQTGARKPSLVQHPFNSPQFFLLLKFVILIKVLTKISLISSPLSISMYFRWNPSLKIHVQITYMH